MPQAHSDYVYTPIQTYGYNFDLMIEAKAKELALLQYRKILNDSFLLTSQPRIDKIAV